MRDNGVGIDPEVLPRIFEAFEQGNRSVTRSFGGLGLGLTISKALVELHGGTIAAASEGPGKGATFTVRLPASATPRAKPPAGGPGDSQRDGRSYRILLVEDNVDTAKVMGRLLTSFGHVVRTAGSVADALQVAGAEPFELVISDIGLPDGSGYDLMRQLRSAAPAPVRGIALSGFGMEEDVRKSREAGFDEHLTKPVNLQRLEAAILRVAAARPATAAAPD